MIIVSDTSPITNLMQIGQLEILEKLYSEIIIPAEVFKELTEIDIQEKDLNSIDWIKVMPVSDLEMVNKLSVHVDHGEAESIVLALELNAELLLIDEKKVEKLQKKMGLR